MIDAEDGARVQHTLEEGRRPSLEIELLRHGQQYLEIEALNPQIEQVNTAQRVQEKRELRLPANSFKWLRLLAFVLSSNIWRRWLSNSLDRLRRTRLPASRSPAHESGQSR